MGGIIDDNGNRGAVGQEVARIQVFLVAPVNPNGPNVGGTRTYTLGLGRSLTNLGPMVTIAGNGRPIIDGAIGFVAASENSLNSNCEYHRRVSRWLRCARFADG